MTRTIGLAALLLFSFAPAARAKDVKPLVDSLAAAQGEDRLPIIRALGASKNPDAVPVLLGIFDVDHSGMKESWTIAEALGELKDPRARPALAEAWRKYDTEQIRGFMKSPDNPVETVAFFSLLRRSVLRALLIVGGPADCGAFVAALDDPTDDHLMIQSAAEGLGRFKCAEGVEPLIRLGAKMPDYAYEPLGLIGGKRAIAALRAAMNGDDAGQRLPAAFGLARAGKAAGRDWLKNYVASSNLTDPKALMAAFYLARLGEPAGLKRLTDALDAADLDFRMNAVSKLGDCGDPRATRALIESLDREPSNVRVLIASALGHLGSPEALAALRRLKTDADPVVQGMAASMLSQSGDQE